MPISSVAFFPGKAIHTNEFLVMLGMDYYVKRSAAQTVDIIDRRLERKSE